MSDLHRRLSLAAAPTFVLMALLNLADPGGSVQLLCSQSSAGLRWTGMTVMYLLMSVFHLPPWLRMQK